MRINLDLNSKRHDIVGPDDLFLSKTTRCNDTYLHYQSKVFEQYKILIFFLYNSLLLTKPAFILSKIQ